MRWIFLALLLQGCAALTIQKNCRPVVADYEPSENDLSICESVLPWER